MVVYIARAPETKGVGASRSKRGPYKRSARLPLGVFLRARCAGTDMARMHGGFGCLQEGHLTWGLLGGCPKAPVKKKNENLIKSYEVDISREFG